MHKLHLKTEQNYVQYMEQAESNMTTVGSYVRTLQQCIPSDEGALLNQGKQELKCKAYVPSSI